MPSRREQRLRPLANLPAGTLLIHEIFASIQGESTYAGLPCVFVRTTACHLRCRYCDTAHAFGEGEPTRLDAILDKVRAYGLRLVEVTGGEPLLQPEVLPLMTMLCDEGYQVLLETSGSLDIRPVDPRVVRIVDLKTPDSGELESNLYSNLDELRAQDELKLVLGSRADYEWARAMLERYNLPGRCQVLMGPAWGAVEPADLAAWILADRLSVRMQLQIHKVIWGPAARGV